MKKIIITGGNGFLGKVLMNYFQDSADQIILLSRKPISSKKYPSSIQTHYWDGKSLGDWAKVLEGADALINLAGRSVDCRYTPKHKEEILSSRIQSTAVLGKAIMQCLYPPKVWLNASTATIYRHAEHTLMNETTGEIGSGFSVNVARQWESTFFDCNTPKTRKVALRTAIVLGKQGGALPPLIRLTQIGMGGKQGSGNQKFSWIHKDDFARSIAFIIQNTTISGQVNIAAPNPVTNTKLMAILRKSLHRSIGLPMGKFILEIGAWFIRTETELILKSRNIMPQVLVDAQFSFKYPQIDKAITHLIHTHD